MHPALLADLTKEREQVPSDSNQYLVQSHTSGQGYDAAVYSHSKYTTASTSGTGRQQQQPMSNMTQPSTAASSQTQLESAWNNTGHAHPPPPPSQNSAYLPPQAYAPVPPDTQATFPIMGAPVWDDTWHTFMDQLGMFSNDPTAPPLPYPAPSQMKMER